MARAFDGIRIIDITHVLAGPFAAYQLALQGADVIKVEHPDDPDQSRGTGSDRALNHAGMGTGFLTQASNKRSITLDLKTPAGREILQKLVATADVLVENFRPGAFEALGLGYEDLRKINPKLIYASFSAFGQGGPRRTQTAYDHVIQSTSGIMAMTGTPEVHPVKIGAPAIDYATGTMGAFALASALFQRERTGAGPAHRHGDAGRGDDPDGVAPDRLPAQRPAPEAQRQQASARHQQRLSDAGRAGDAGRVEPAPAEAAVDGAGTSRHDQAHATTSATRIMPTRKQLLEQIMLTRTAAEWEEFLQARHVPACARAHDGRGGRRSAACHARRAASFRRRCAGRRGAIQRAGGGVHVRP